MSRTKKSLRFSLELMTVATKQYETLNMTPGRYSNKKEMHNAVGFLLHPFHRKTPRNLKLHFLLNTYMNLHKHTDKILVVEDEHLIG